MRRYKQVKGRGSKTKLDFAKEQEHMEFSSIRCWNGAEIRKDRALQDVRKHITCIGYGLVIDLKYELVIQSHGAQSMDWLS